MNRVILAIALTVLMIGVLEAQVTKTDVRVKTLSEQRVIALNGKLRDAVAGGESRAIIPIDLPPGTIEWFYSFSTAAGVSGTKNLNLAIQLSSYTFDLTGISGKILTQLRVPGGTNAINIYVMDADNRTFFLEGDDFQSIEEGSSQVTKEGVVKVDDVKTGRWFIGIENPSALDGVNVTIEVAALVSEEIFIDEWSLENLSLIENACRNTFLSEGNDSAKRVVCDCFIQELQTTTKPSRWQKLGKDKVAFETSLLERCYLSTNQIALRDQERVLAQERSEANLLIEESHAAFDINNIQGAKDKMVEAITLIQDNQLESNYSQEELATIYNDMAWYALLTNDLDIVEYCLQKGHAFGTDNMYLWSNTGLYHLLKGDTFEAEKAFSRYNRKDKLPDGQRWDEAVSEQLLLLERRGLGNQHFAAIRDLLKIRK